MNHYFKYLLTILLALVCTFSNAQTTKWKNMHQVGKHETIFGIAKTYNISIQDLIDANPEMKVPGYELKKGIWLFVPFSKSGDKNTQNILEKKQG